LNAFRNELKDDLRERNTKPNRSAILTTSELCKRFATERRASLAVRFI